LEDQEEKTQKRGRALSEIKMLAVASSVGLAMVLSIFFGLALGYYLDKWLGTKPWLLLAGLLVGIVAAFNNFIILTKRLERQRTEKYGTGKDQGGSGEKGK
jgi:ATP synthase protein I